MEKGNLTAKQKVWFLAAMAFLTAPTAVFIFGYSDSFSPKTNAAIALVNMGVVVSAGYLILTKWISKIR